MRYIQLDDSRRIIAHTEAEHNLDENIWRQFNLPDERLLDFNDYLLIDGNLVHDPLPKPIIPATPEEVLGAIVEAQQEELLPLIPDELIERMTPWFQTWDGNGHAYDVGNIVVYPEIGSIPTEENVLYRCIQAHTSQQGWNPVDAASLWAKVLTDPDVPQPWEQPSSTNPYMKGDRVTHVGHTWVSDIDNNVWEPGVYGWTAED